MVRSGSSWGKLGCTGVDGGVDGEQGMSTGVDGVVSDVGGVCDVGGSGTSCFRGFWGKLGGWGVSRGRSAGSSRVRRCSGAVGGGPESHRAGVLVIDDMAWCVDT